MVVYDRPWWFVISRTCISHTDGYKQQQDIFGPRDKAGIQVQALLVREIVTIRKLGQRPNSGRIM